MKRNIILSTLAAALLGTAALPVQAQGIYVNKKNGESIAYPKAILDKVTPEVFSDVQSTKVKGAVATLQYERIADMSTAREGHQIFPSGNGIVVVGGMDVNYAPLQTAEIYQNGQWRTINVGSAHGYGFSAILSDGRVMVGGGRLSAANDGNYSKKTAIYDPSTQTFTAGPDMTTGRMSCSAITVGNKVYVNGNYINGDDKTMDCYDGSSFKAVGATYERYSPAIFASESGLIWTWGVYDTSLKETELYTTEDGKKGLLFNTYNPATGESSNFYATNLATNKPLTPSWEVRPSEFFCTDKDSKGYFFLTKDSEGKYQLKQIYESEKNPGTLSLTTYNFEIPSVFPNTQISLDYGGFVFVNNQRNEVYMIGYDKNDKIGKTIYLISYNYTDGNWTIAKADGLVASILGGSMCILPDGRLVCTGGYGENSVIQKCAYIFTPPVAGLTTSAEGKGVNVWKTDGTYDSYTESELESITTYEEEFDERITHEIPVEYLSKMSAYMPIYSGSTPPIIEGTWMMSPTTVVHDGQGNWKAGKVINDVTFHFSSQNTSQNTIEYSKKESQDYANASNVAVLGKDNHFTAFLISEGKTGDISTKEAALVSGTVTDNGIKDMYYAFILLDKSADPDRKVVDVGVFRCFKDGDGLSEPTPWSTRIRSGQTTSSEIPESLRNLEVEYLRRVVK